MTVGGVRMQSLGRWPAGGRVAPMPDLPALALQAGGHTGPARDQRSERYVPTTGQVS